MLQEDKKNNIDDTGEAEADIIEEAEADIRASADADGDNDYDDADDEMYEDEHFNLRYALKEILSFCATVGVIVGICYLILGVIVNIVVVDGESMEPTLRDGQIVIVNHAFYKPERGDIIVCTPTDYHKQLIKRIIGMPGDVIDINFETGQVYVNGGELAEDYIAEPTRTNFGTQFPLTVDSDCVFVMGDNRNNSYDSRFSQIGQIKIDEIQGGLLFNLGG